jgi:hypothetical protein
MFSSKLASIAQIENKKQKIFLFSQSALKESPREKGDLRSGESKCV